MAYSFEVLCVSTVGQDTRTWVVVCFATTCVGGLFLGVANIRDDSFCECRILKLGCDQKAQLAIPCSRNLKVSRCGAAARHRRTRSVKVLAILGAGWIGRDLAIFWRQPWEDEPARESAPRGRCCCRLGICHRWESGRWLDFWARS